MAGHLVCASGGEETYRVCVPRSRTMGMGGAKGVACPAARVYAHAQSWVEGAKKTRVLIRASAGAEGQKKRAPTSTFSGRAREDCI
jgi:hypothetical protein